MHKLLKPLALLSIGFLVGAISINLAPDSQNDQLYQILSSAQSQGQVKITPLVVNDNSRSLNKNFHFANVSGINFEQFQAQKDYIVKVKADENLLRIQLPEQSTLPQQIADISGVHIEENITLQAQELPESDTNINKINSYLGLKGNSINLESDSHVTVAIIDSGLYDPEQYLNRLSINKREQQGIKNFDDDNNGYVDDFYGWSALENSGQFSDTNGHGTHLAGLIMALTQDTDPQSIKILPIQVLDEQNQVKLSELLVGLDYAKKRQADIINLSIGTSAKSELLEEAIDELHDQDIILVASAGNNGKNQVLNPANNSDVIAVSALNYFDKKADYANYGPEVEFSIKGGAVSLGQTELTYKSGTSQSAALVSALLAIQKATHPQESNSRIINYLKSLSIDNDTPDLGHKLKLQNHF